MERLMGLCTPEPNTGCWLWTGQVAANGYGIVEVDYSPMRAHRLSYMLHGGRLARDGVVMHRCDVRCCVNPAHLRLGTHRDNMADKVRKGRQDRGSLHGNAKLTEEAVLAMRHLRRAGWTGARLAALFGVSEDVARNAANGKTWTHVEAPGADETESAA